MKTQHETVRLAEAMLEFRLHRPHVFPAGMFSETGWEFLLALFVADAHGEATNGQAICERIGAAPSVASRWLKFLSVEGLVDGDGSGDLDDPLTISAKAVDRMEHLLEEAQELRNALLPNR